MTTLPKVGEFHAALRAVTEVLDATGSFVLIFRPHVIEGEEPEKRLALGSNAGQVEMAVMLGLATLLATRLPSEGAPLPDLPPGTTVH